MRPGRYAAIDIGTVTSRMLVVDVDASGTLHELTREYAITNLGEGVDRSRTLKPEAIERVADAVQGFMRVLDRFKPEDGSSVALRAMTTSAARDARNAQDFIDRLARVGVNVEVIPGEREAALSFAGAASAFAVGERLAVVDVGGGSTEVIAGIAGGMASTVTARSFNIGCRRVTEKFLASDPPAAVELEAARTWMRGQFAPYIDELRASGALGGSRVDAASSEEGLPQQAVDSLSSATPRLPARLVAVAGTATTAVSIREAMQVYDTARVHLARVTRDELDAQLDQLASLPLEQRRCVVGLDPGRAPVIVAGFLVLQQVMDLVGADSFTVSETDILHGIIADVAR